MTSCAGAPDVNADSRIVRPGPNEAKSVSNWMSTEAGVIDSVDRVSVMKANTRDAETANNETTIPMEALRAVVGAMLRVQVSTVADTYASLLLLLSTLSQAREQLAKPSFLSLVSVSYSVLSRQSSQFAGNIRDATTPLL